VQNIATILSQCPALPTELPVIVLTECYHLPGTVLPLCIFEQRYRDMLDYALSTSRMFCVAVKKDRHDASATPEVFPYATAGLIQSSVKHDDDTSNLLLLGLRRVRFTGWRSEGLFRVASIVECATQAEEADIAKAKELIQIIERTTHGQDLQIKTLLSFLTQNGNPELTADVIAYHFVHKASLLRKMLQEPVLSQRLGALFTELNRTLSRV
jgi:Lon protease-like protein